MSQFLQRCAVGSGFRQSGRLFNLGRQSYFTRARSTSTLVAPVLLRTGNQHLPITNPVSLMPRTCTLPSSRFFSSEPQKQEENAEELIPQTFQRFAGWRSQAIRTECFSQHRHMRGSMRKLAFVLNLIRGLSVEEALIQLHFSKKRMAVLVANCIRNARFNAVNQFNMDPDRLVVHFATATKGTYGKKVEWKAMGKVGIMHQYRSHLKIGVREVPPELRERRLGKWGRSHATIERTLKHIEEERERREAAEEAEMKAI